MASIRQTAPFAPPPKYRRASGTADEVATILGYFRMNRLEVTGLIDVLLWR